MNRRFNLQLWAVTLLTLSFASATMGAGLNSLTQSSTALGNGWYHSSWYGYFKTNQPSSAAGWILHNEHGWLYIYQDPGSGYSVHDIGSGLTLAFSSSDYPSMYAYSGTGSYWLRYAVGSASLRQFLVESGPNTGQLIELPANLGYIPDGPNGPVPVWWKTMGLVDLSKGSNNRAPLTIGQLKHVATRTRAYLEAQMGVTAGNWTNAYSAFGGDPFPLSAGSPTSNRMVANIGQLKYLASGVYQILDQLPEVDVLDYFARRGLTSADYQLNPPLPWPSNTTTGANAAPANLGQLKLVFGFFLEPADYYLPGTGGSWDQLELGSDDADKDLWSDGLEAFMGLGSGFTTLAQLRANLNHPDYSQALAQHLVNHPGTSGPVLLIPGQGLFRIHRHLLSLHQL